MLAARAYGGRINPTALGLILGGRKDAGAHRALFGFTNKQAAEQVGETLKDLSPHERAEHRDEIKWDGW
jgi:hypothetical protein